MQRKQILTYNDNNTTEYEYSDFLESSYLDYSMSVITDRAVPDLRDGLKPVQRRILYAMYKENNFHNKPYKKTAKISGITSGNYHPHGNVGIEDAIVTMAQPFKKPVTLIDGQGNFGSVEGDGAAAARYTEIRLSEFTEECMTSLLEDNVVKYIPNYDNTLMQPSVLASLIPSVLITGADGIAVGMSCNIPTFNLSEIIDANIYVLTHKRVTLNKLLDIIPGPDFPTGGIVCNKPELENIYKTGKGSLRLRGKVSFHRGRSKEHDKLIVEEIPYTMVGKSMITFMQKIVSLIESGDLVGIADVIDETKESARIVIELYKSADVDYIKQVLFSKTKLEDTMPVNMLVLDNGIPRTLGILDVLNKYTEFQKELYTNKIKNDINDLNNKLEILNAYIICCNDIDNVVKIIKSSKTTKDAEKKLLDTYNMTDTQVDAILAMRLSKLVSMEVDKISKDINFVKKELDSLTKVLNDEKLLVKKIVTELNKFKEKYGYERKTLVEDIEKCAAPVKKEQEQKLAVLINQFNYIHSIPYSTYVKNIDSINTSFVHNLPVTNLDTLYLFDDKGIIYKIPVKDIPLRNLRDEGIPVDNLTSGKFSTQNDILLKVLPEKEVDNLLIITKSGRSKQLDKLELDGSRRYFTYIPLQDNDKVFKLYTSDKPDKLTIGTNSGKKVTFKCKDIPFKPRTHKGVTVLKLVSGKEYIETCN